MATVINDGNDHVPVVFGRRTAGGQGDAMRVFK